MNATSSHFADAQHLLRGIGVNQTPQGLWELTDVHTASTCYVHHSQKPAALAAYAAVDETFASGRFPDYLLRDMVDKIPAMDYPEYAALAMACGSPMPSFISADARAQIFGKSVWSIVEQYQLGDCFMRFNQPSPGNGDHYSLRPRGIDWAGTWDVIPEDIKALRKAYRGMSPVQKVMVLTIMRLYNQSKDKIYLTGCPTKITATEALKILRENGALSVWGSLVTHYAGW
ncbi:hypothetical protein [Pseudomonas amygdali]|uniref:hypothetical protein n=1 Tax=Pseudomonas amygdali TaxID=47877 RepID=UPI0006E5D565|nr:hypothetical protein [Pseudomonas amygdali]KPY55658.1 hypothetical protein ALO93_200125 [Pseudomonas amygdali pv. sesami]